MSFFTKFVSSSADGLPQDRNLGFLVDTLESRLMLTGADSGADPVDSDTGDEPPVVADDDYISEE